MNDSPASTSPSTTGPHFEDEGVSIVALVNVLLRRRRLVILGPLLLVLVVVTVRFFAPREYTASSMFTPQATKTNAAAAFSGLAAQFGVQLGQGATSESPSFYVALVDTWGLLRAVAATPFETPVAPAAADTVTVALPEWFEVEPTDPDDRIRAPVGQLRQWG